MQYGQRWCIRFTRPQAGHLHNELTSFSALPAICRCRFFMCEVFFLGTARRIDSQMSPSNDGNDGSNDGHESEMAGRRGAAATSCRVNSEANRSVRDGMNVLNAAAAEEEEEEEEEDGICETEAARRGSIDAETAVRAGPATAAAMASCGYFSKRWVSFRL
ncbi:hypothetical protein SPI_07109 [Niveomyces insectorum RCEF 264]|uniref:Uncharacterized protein n=1 Tax=Niveomyces insectorum RCEF 264 TaxID=1081102 RepID=A0A167QA61_9HYPO|nr:hypothetical protein SPI_07109 [Niveomyces insectorum RCEF 264]